MEWMILPLKRYAEFSGRSRRKEYWMFFLLQLIVATVLLMPVFMLSADAAREPNPQIPTLAVFLLGAFGVWALATLIPNLAVQVRRLHDTDKSGWFILLGLIPVVNYVGGLVLLVFYCLDGTKGDNQYGPDPKMNENIGDVFD